MDTLKNLLSNGRFTAKILWLRTEMPPSEIKVYRAKPDGTKGKFLRTDQPILERERYGEKGKTKKTNTLPYNHI